VNAMPKRIGKEGLLAEIMACSDMLQGSIVKLNARCGKKGCRCERGEYHGVSSYLSYKENGRTRMVYIPKSLVPEVQRRICYFKRYWELGVKLARLNLNDLKGNPR
jgi:hypothetical protein